MVVLIAHNGDRKAAARVPEEVMCRKRASPSERVPANACTTCHAAANAGAHECARNSDDRISSRAPMHDGACGSGPDARWSVACRNVRALIRLPRPFNTDLICMHIMCVPLGHARCI